MQLHTHNQLQWIAYDLLSDIPSLTHASFKRQGGVSLAPYHALNLGYHTEDDPQAVQQNLTRVRDALSISTLKFVRQCHELRESIVEEDANIKDEKSDILLTSRKEIGLMINHADCQAAIFYDPINHALAVVHSGWRGSVKNIYAHTIGLMQKRFRSSPKELLVCISPSLGPQAAEFTNYQTELPPHFWDFQIKPLYFDFWAISRMQLEKCGILPHHIEIASLCTYSNPQDYFSYRRDGKRGIKGGHGVHGTIAVLR